MENLNTRRLILEHCTSYPRLTVQDILKYIYQSALGCEHSVTSEQAAVEHLQVESAALSPSYAVKNLVEPLDGDYSRVHLAVLERGIALETLARLFFLSAKREDGGYAKIDEKLALTDELVRENLLPFSEMELAAAAELWKNAGYPPVHHSDAFREAYRPSYRVIANRFVPYLPVLAAVDRARASGENGITIDSEVEKNALAALLREIYGGSVSLAQSTCGSCINIQIK